MATPKTISVKNSAKLSNNKLIGKRVSNIKTKVENGKRQQPKRKNRKAVTRS